MTFYKVIFTVLYTNLSPQPAETHEQFIAEAIQKNPAAKWRIIISHYSPITMVERYQGIRENLRYIYPYIAETYDIDLFISGHDHIYTRGYFLNSEGDPIEGQTTEYVFDNPDQAVYVVFNGATNALLRQPDSDYPWSAISVQNDIPSLTEVHVTDNSINVVTHDADSWATIDNFTIYKD